MTMVKRKSSDSEQARADSNVVNSDFPAKLHYMLNEVEKDGLDHIVSWQPHGRSFVVHKRYEFVKEILPYWFSQSKYASFQRQLNLYGFTRITTGRDKGGYFHKWFLRGKEAVACRIKRTKVKGTGPRKPASPEDEPDFYAQSPCLSSAATPSLEGEGEPGTGADKSRHAEIAKKTLHQSKRDAGSSASPVRSAKVDRPSSKATAKAPPASSQRQQRRQPHQQQPLSSAPRSTAAGEASFALPPALAATSSIGGSILPPVLTPAEVANVLTSSTRLALHAQLLQQQQQTQLRSLLLSRGLMGGLSSGLGVGIGLEGQNRLRAALAGRAGALASVLQSQRPLGSFPLQERQARTMGL